MSSSRKPCTRSKRPKPSAVFDDDNLVSSAGLVPVMALAEQTGLRRLLAAKVRCIDDIDVVRSGGMKTLFGVVYAPSTVERCCGSSPSGMPDSWSRCCASTWWRCAGESICLDDRALAVGALAHIPSGRFGANSAPKGPTKAHRKSWTDQRLPHAHTPKIGANENRLHSTRSVGG
jgi:hypothetical protein